MNDKWLIVSEDRKQRSRNIDKVIFPLGESLSKMPDNYQGFISEVKAHIKQSRLKAVISANKAMIVMYWHIGNAILKQQNKEGWGTKVIDRISLDLKEAFPDEKGFSPRNLKYMRAFADAWPDIEFVQRCVAQISW